MTPFALSRRALEDLRTLARYTDIHWGRAQRNLYLEQMDEAFNLLARNPQAGKACDEIRVGYRKLPQGSHVIFYRAGSDGVIEIVRILHRGMDHGTALIER